MSDYNTFSLVINSLKAESWVEFDLNNLELHCVTIFDTVWSLQSYCKQPIILANGIQIAKNKINFELKLENGADVHASCFYGTTPLHKSAQVWLFFKNQSDFN